MQNPSSLRTPSGAVVLACRSTADARTDDAQLRTEALIDLLDALDQPFDLSVVVVARDGLVATGLIVKGPDDASTSSAADHLAVLARAVGLPVGLTGGDAGLLGPLGAEHAFLLEAAPGSPPPAIDRSSSFLAAAAELSDGHEWRLVVELGPLDDDGDRHCGISLVGHGPGGQVLVALAARELGLRHPLRPRALRGADVTDLAEQQERGTAPAACLLDRAEVARALTMGLRRRETPVDAGELVARLIVTNPPHLWLLGGSGTGKTTLLEHLLEADLEAGRRVIVLDPHRDLASRAASVFDALGKEVDVHDLDGPVRWNVCRPETGVPVQSWSGELAAIVRDLWPSASEDVFGPVWHRAIRAALRVLVEDPAGPWPITRLPELFLESELLDAALERIGDPALTAVWEAELQPRLRDREGGAFLNWLLAKVDPLIGDPVLASVVGADELDVRLAGERSVIVHIPVGGLGPDGSRFLAGMALSQLWASARRGGTSEVAVYVDEWQRAATPSLSRLLGEGRKYGIRLRLANQHAAQLRGDLFAAIDGNAGGIVSFRAGRLDAELLAGQLDGVRPADLLGLPDHHVLALVGGEAVRARTLDRPATAAGVLGRLAVATTERRSLLGRLAATINETR